MSSAVIIFTLQTYSVSTHLNTTGQLFSLSNSLRPAKMPENAEAVSATLTTNRNCTIELTNVTTGYCLINPKYVGIQYSNLLTFHTVYHYGN